MAYATIEDLKKRISLQKIAQLTDFTDTGNPDIARVTTALDFASAMVDSYAGGRYTLPLQASNQIKDLTVTIAVYKLHEGRQLAPEAVRLAYSDAVAFLKDVAAGKASLDQATTVQSSGFDVVKKNHDEEPDAFDNTRLANWMG